MLLGDLTGKIQLEKTQDSIPSYDQSLQDASLLRRYLLDRGFKVIIKAE